MGLITRQIGPDAKGSKLTFVEMDENLYYLQSLGVSGLTFSNNTLSLINPTGGTLTVSINAGSTFTGGTVTGSTIFTNGLTANTLTVNGVSITGDTYTTGGTYSNGTIDFYYNTGGGYQVDVTGLTDNDIYVTGFTYQNNTFTISDNSGSTFNATINTVTGLTINGNETINNGKLTINQNNGVVGVDVVNSTEAMVQVQNSPTELSIFGRFTGETYIYSSLLVPIVFYTNGNNKRMVIDSIGNVGVGTTSPLTKLHVSGNTLINGSLTATTISATTYQNLPTYDYEIHVSTVDGNDTTGNGDLLNPVATITKALTLLTGSRKTIIIHPGTYSENVTVANTNTTISTSELTGANTLLSGTLTIGTLGSGTRISGLKMSSLVISGTAQAYISNCTVDNQVTKSSSGFVEIINSEMQCISGIQISGSGTTIINGNKNVGISVSNASAQVIVKGCNSVVTPSASAGNLSIVDCIVTALGGNGITITGSLTTLTLINSQVLVTAGNNVAPISVAGIYTIINTVYDKPGSTLTGTSTNSIDYFQYINADKFITQGGTSSKYVMGDGSLSNGFTGGTVTGSTSFTDGLSANTISATTYLNLPTDIRVTGGTYSAGTITFINNTGGTFNVTGITKTLNNEWLIASGTTVEIESFTQKFLYGDLYVSGLLQLNENSQLVILNGDLILSGGTISGSGQTTLVDLPTVNDLISSGTYSAGTLTLSTLNGSDVFISGFYTGTTQFTNGLTANTISATTYQNLPDNVTGKYLPLSGGTVTGSTFFTNGLTANTISATTLQSSNTYIESTGYLYFGDNNTNGSWRMRISGPNFIVEKRVSGNWIISGTFN